MEGDLKRVCIIDKKNNLVIRVTRGFAEKIISSSPNVYKYTSKATLHKFLKADKKKKYQTEIGARRLAAVVSKHKEIKPRKNS